jgi:hypothetical protein
MRRSILIASTVLLGSLLAACGTPEYYQNRQVCDREWSARIPPDYRQVLVNKTRRVEVPDGTETCTTIGYTTRCEKGMRTEWIPYTAVETQDANEPARDAKIRECTQARCLRIYGNADCKV